jgi:hypothetical protein
MKNIHSLKVDCKISVDACPAYKPPPLKRRNCILFKEINTGLKRSKNLKRHKTLRSKEFNIMLQCYKLSKLEI